MRIVPSVVLAVPAALLIAAPVAAAQPAVPSADQLTAQLQRALNTSLSDEARAAELEGGLAAVPTANNIASVMDRYSSMMSWKVQNPVAAGDRVNAQLAVSIPVMGTRTHDIYWIDQDGSWKLSNVSGCVIARDAAGTECTV
ncbi:MULTISPECIES: hypothetical protein [Mycobacteriaceae]|jgi:hypothetical protein|uniref:hypothetical protein n=1 Tax=Mycobacteriaceae TaxID=1762 RepID=UPI0007FFD02A|nr:MULTISPECIES: hypothetical protein [Mycobacteriaceae]MCK0174527.1 hypothetical protein [Mycolicibacterium sp. F2034L]OBB59083.1 hypothetical protein A5757_01275 [Mycobacterium sp. 852013-51886_SCH5428379]